MTLTIVWNKEKKCFDFSDDIKKMQPGEEILLTKRDLDYMVKRLTRIKCEAKEREDEYKYALKCAKSERDDARRILEAERKNFEGLKETYRARTTEMLEDNSLLRRINYKDKVLYMQEITRLELLIPEDKREDKTISRFNIPGEEDL